MSIYKFCRYTKAKKQALTKETCFTCKKQLTEAENFFGLNCFSCSQKKIAKDVKRT